MEDHCSFSLLAKNLKKQSFKARSLNHFGFFDPDPVLLAQLFNPLLHPPAWQRAQDQDQKIPKWFEDHASKLHFFKFLASNQNGRCLVKKSAITIGYERAFEADKSGCMNQRNIKRKKYIINNDFNIFGYVAD